MALYLEANYVDEWLLYLAPSILGHQAQNLFRLPEFTSLSDAHALQWHDIRQVGHDLRIITRRKPITPIDTSHLARYP